MSLEKIMDNTIIEEFLTDEQKMFRQVVRKWCKKEITPNTREWSKIEGFCWPLFNALAKEGYLGMMVPEEYGGSNGTIVDLVILSEELARTGLSIPLTHMSSPAIAIKCFANEEQKARLLPELVAGTKVFCYAQTEANAGSDVANMSSTAVLKGDHWVLNGTKMFITSSTVGDVFITLAKTDMEAKGTEGISVFIVEKGMPGLSFGKMEEKMGRHTWPMCPVIMEDCIVPLENRIVEHGDGFRKMIKEFNGERCGNTSMCVGYAWGAMDRTLEYMQQRVVQGKTLDKLQGLRWMVAEDLMQLFGARFMLYNASLKYAKGENIAADAALCKCFANEMAQKVTNDCMQLHGGYGYMKDYEIERYYRDSRGLSFGGGSTQVLKNRIASELFRR